MTAPTTVAVGDTDDLPTLADLVGMLFRTDGRPDDRTFTETDRGRARWLGVDPDTVVVDPSVGIWRGVLQVRPYDHLDGHTGPNGLPFAFWPPTRVFDVTIEEIPRDGGGLPLMIQPRPDMGGDMDGELTMYEIVDRLFTDRSHDAMTSRGGAAYADEVTFEVGDEDVECIPDCDVTGWFQGTLTAALATWPTTTVLRRFRLILAERPVMAP